MFNPSKERSERDFLIKDIREMNDFLREQDKATTMMDLGKPSAYRTLSVILMDWAFVFISTSLVYFHSLWWLPISMIVIGSRQRALVVLIHDASHFLLARNRTANDIIANLFLCFPMLKSLKHYRAIHIAHHMNLGDKKHDADYLHNPEEAKKGWQHIYFKNLFSYDLWIVAELKQMIKNISKKHMLFLGLWWSTALASLAGLFGFGYAATFFALWFFARAVVYHVITTFIIISDHHGLFPGTILEYTRNHPSHGFVRWFIHPHNNGFHLTHHLAYFVPFYNLGRAKDLLKGWARYDNSEHCETYFWGEKSVVNSWGKCTRKIDAPDTASAFNALKEVIQASQFIPHEKVEESCHVQNELLKSS